MPVPCLCFNLLGPFEIRHDKTELRLAAKPKILLAALLLQTGRRVSAAYLAEAVWGTSPPLKPRASLYSYVMRVRKTLASASFDPNHLYAAGDGYILDARSAELDLTCFERYRAQAAEARTAGDEETEMAALRSALGLWRGNALEDLPSDVLREGPARQLDEARLALLQRRIALDLDAGRHDEIVPVLIELTSAYPLREVFWKQLISAQYRSERRADALESYRRASALLRGELGIDPSTELEALHDDILNDRRPARTPTTAITAAAEPVTIPAARHGGTARQCQLPRDVPDFVGREHALTSILDTLRPDGVTPGIVALHGPRPASARPRSRGAPATSCAIGTRTASGTCS
ncbi:hypothetical protein DMP23_20570 [Amycolatopsis sp. A1MSW2902]|uniref:AfsR/SARP family transcriptional regulator n=1 Tax=Amycolatopsis sp. A1MSW2902 TaxID=687413 RepID=UPI00307DF899